MNIGDNDIDTRNHKQVITPNQQRGRVYSLIYDHFQNMCQYSLPTPTKHVPMLRVVAGEVQVL